MTPFSSSRSTMFRKSRVATRDAVGLDANKRVALADILESPVKLLTVALGARLLLAVDLGAAGGLELLDLCRVVLLVVLTRA